MLLHEKFLHRVKPSDSGKQARRLLHLIQFLQLQVLMLVAEKT